MQKKWIRPLLAVIAVPVIAAGVFQMVRAYEDGTAFQPAWSNRKLQVNQVVFSGDEDTASQKNNEGKEGESELWEKDRTAEDALSPELKNSADYLFQTGRSNLLNGTGSINLAGDEAGNNTLLPADSTTGTGGFIYDITGDRDNADGVIAVGSGSISGTGSGNGSGSSDQGDSGTNGSATVKPADQTETPSPEPAPTARPADTVKDPESTKEKPNDAFTHGDYNENVTFTEPSINILVSYDALYNGNYLYEGQTVNDRDMYNALDTYVTDGWDAYDWGEEHFGKYVRIVGVSFDGGDTWTAEYPVTIPTGLSEEQMIIRVQYRFHSTDAWTLDCQTDVTYEPAACRVYALTEKLTWLDQVIDPEKIANKYDQYPEPDSIFNLYQYQEALLGTEGTLLTKLFPGWMEKDQQVSFAYPLESGRHVLEPMDMVELAPEYIVQVKSEYIPEEYLGTDIQYPLQTLTEYTPMSADTLEIPEYIQAVDPEDWISADVMKLPASVVYVNTESTNMAVAYAYIVDDGNPCLTAGEDGILYNKNRTKILGIPSYTTDIDVPSNVESVVIPGWNMLLTIHLEAASAAEIPQMNLENLFTGCTFTMSKTILYDFMDRYEAYLEGSSIQGENSDAVYTVQDHLAVDEDGTLGYVLKSAPKLLRLPDSVKHIGKQAFAQSSTEELVIAEAAENLVLDENCLEDSKVRVIWCYTEVQRQRLEEQLKLTGKSDVKVQVVREQKVTTKQGYTYIIKEPEQTAELLAAPADIVYFDGIVRDDNGNEIQITAIGDGAFKNHTSLEWVMLPENIKYIGAEAFRGCTSLQGVLMDSRDEMTIGNNAFLKCDAIRFLASNAFAVRTENDYLPVFKDEAGQSVFYIPTEHSQDPDCLWMQEGAECTFFEAGDGVEAYSLESIGDSSKMLYAVGYNGVMWQSDVPFMAIRSGTKVDEQVVLPETTQEILSGAMRNTHSAGDSYTVNWKDLSLIAIDDYAFADSDVSGEITFGVYGYYSYLLEYAFKNCSKITDITVNGTLVKFGEGCVLNCSGLVNVTLVDFGTYMYGDTLLHYYIPSYTFEGCTSIKALKLPGTLPDLTVPTRGETFCLSGYETDPETEKGLLVVPEENRQACLEAWKYSVLGYSNEEDLEAAAQDAAFDALIETGEFWTQEEIDAWKAEQIERGQRMICNWLGIDYPYDAEESTCTAVSETYGKAEGLK